MAAYRGPTTNLGHRTPRTRALDVGTDARGFMDTPGYDMKRGIPASAAPGTPTNDLADAMASITASGRAHPLTQPRKMPAKNTK